MRTKFKVLFLIITSLFFVVLSYFALLYFFTKEPKPIEVYTFPISCNELEKRIGKEFEKELKGFKNKDSLFHDRYVTLGKDSAKYFFITNFDKNKNNKCEKAWVEFLAVSDSSSKLIRMSYENKDQYPERIKIFEDEFIKKLAMNESKGFKEESK